MNPSEKVFDLLRMHEGLCKVMPGTNLVEAYRCPAGVWTIGYGHTGSVDGVAVHAQMRITRDRAAELLREDAAVFARELNTLAAKTGTTFTQNQFDAFLCLTFNIGTPALAKSRCWAAFCRHDFATVLREWDWGEAQAKREPKKFGGLLKRRAAERALFSEA